jgi:hypothetical protein
MLVYQRVIIEWFPTFHPAFDWKIPKKPCRVSAVQITNNNVRDQLAVVESLSTLAGILHVKVGAAAYACFCGPAWADKQPVGGPGGIPCR